MTLTLKQLEILHAIVVSGSISQATRMVGLSQPTLSQQLAKLEEGLGAQLIVRGRATGVTLTAAGEYWFRQASEILYALDKAKQNHKVMFDDRNLALRFGTTPSLRGRFTELAAQAAVEVGQFVRFDFLWAATSDEVVEMINTHKLNCGVVSAASIEAHRSSLYVEHLWRDRIVWTVPAGIPDDVIHRTLETGQDPGPDHQAMSRYVDITAAIPWEAWSDNWFRTRLPFASPFFGCMTHQAALDVVAAGIATCHSPLSLMRSVPHSVHSRIKVFDPDEYARDVVLVMPKHLMSLRPFKAFCERISAQIRKIYGSDFTDDERRQIVLSESSGLNRVKPLADSEL